MNSFRTSLIWLVMLLATALVAGCGGSSSKSPNTDNKTLSGVVVDPAIAGATVELRDANGAALSMVVVTDETGTFNLSVPHNVNLTGALIISRGGVDQETGYSFDNAHLRAPVNNTSPVVSPLSTLVVELVEQESLTQSEAIQQVAAWFGIAAENVLADPRTLGASQLASLKVTALLNAIRNEPSPSETLTHALYKNSGNLNDVIAELEDAAVVSSTATSLDTAKQLFDRLSATHAEAADDVVMTFNLANITLGLELYFSKVLPSLNFSNQTSQLNLQSLAQAVIANTDGRGAPADSLELVSLGRYLLNQQGLDQEDNPYNIIESTITSADFDVTDLAYEGTTEIVKARGVISSNLPLADGELLGNDNQNRIEYFYSSDVSPFYRASQYVRDVLDDVILDPIFRSIASGQARVGLKDRAAITLNTRIFQTSERVEAQREIAVELAKNGRQEDSPQFMEQAIASALHIVNAKGVGMLDSAETVMLIKLMRATTLTDTYQLSEQILAPLEEFTEINAGNGNVRTLYGRVIAAINNATGSGYLEELVSEWEQGGSREEAIRLLDLYRDIVMGTPKQANNTETVKALYLAWVAHYETRLGIDPWGTVDTLLALRTATPSTNINTSAASLAYVYGKNGRSQEYLDLISSLGLNTNQQKNSLRNIAVWQAIDAATGEFGNNVVDAIDELVASFETPSEKLDVLLWAANNQSDQGLALRLVSAGYPELAEEVAAYAAGLVASTEWQDAYTDNAAQLVTAGCAKTAWAWARVGNTTAAQSAAAGCKSFIDTYNWSTSAFKASAYNGLVSTALLNMGDDETIGVLAGNIFDLNINIGSTHQSVANYAAYAGLDNLALQAMEAAWQLLPTLPLENSLSENDRLGQINSIVGHASGIQVVHSEFRKRIALDGAPDSVRLGTLSSLTSLGKNLLLSEISPLIDEINKLSNVTNHKNSLNGLTNAMASLGFYDQAISAAKNHRASPDLNAGIGSVASALVRASAFPGSLHASQDLDGDGKPDFFHPVGAGAPLNPYTLDDDIDGDGCLDVNDRRPFAFASGLADCS